MPQLRYATFNWLKLAARENGVQSVSEYFEMGGHGIYIWFAYMIATLVIVGILAHTLHTMRQRERHLDLLRRERRGVDDGDDA